MNRRNKGSPAALGDKLHPHRAGYQAMAKTIDLNVRL
jgi:lysophospholipase L1-like esterase